MIVTDDQLTQQEYAIFQNIQMPQTFNIEAVCEFGIERQPCSQKIQAEKLSTVMRLGLSGQSLLLLHPENGNPIKKHDLSYEVLCQDHLKNIKIQGGNNEGEKTEYIPIFELLFPKDFKQQPKAKQGPLYSHYNRLALLPNQGESFQKFKLVLRKKRVTFLIDTPQNFFSGVKIQCKKDSCIIYQVKSHQNGKKYLMEAIPFLDPLDPLITMGLQRNLAQWTALQHPHIMPIRRVFRTKNTLYVITEYIFDNLKYYYAKNGIVPGNIKKHMKVLVNSLKDFHSHQLFHGGISPDSILMKVQAEHVHPLFFGISKVGCFSDPASQPSQVMVQEAHQPFSGQVEKMSKDIVDLGKTFYFMLTLSQNINEDVSKIQEDVRSTTAQLIIDKQTSFPYPDDSAIDLLLRMLDPCPEKRITATEAVEHPYLKDSDS